MIELPSKPTQRWNEYLDAESRGTRKQKRGSLDRFIHALLEQPKENWMEWATHFCRQRELETYSLVIRQPLFERVLFPALLDAWQAGAPGSLRLMAGFFDHIYRSRSCLCQIPDEIRSPELLLREELRLNPNDLRAGLLLVSFMARYVSHTLHELRAGVLYGMDGASIAECAELVEHIAEFKDVAERFGVYDNYKELIHDATFHYNAYSAYLQFGNYAGGYREFLKSYDAP